jgi:hypothetical protein
MRDSKISHLESDSELGIDLQSHIAAFITAMSVFFVT